MKLNKFDKQLQETLENRRLQPSNDAWEQLSNRLDKAGNKQNKNAFWYIGVAASVIGLLLLAVPFYNTKPVEPTIVNTPVVKQKNATEIVSEPSKTTLDKIPIKQIEPSNSNSKIIENKKIAMTEQVISNKTKQRISTSKDEKMLTFEEQKIQEVVVKVQDMKSQNKQVSDAVIDALLLEAQKEIRLKQAINMTRVVDANKLLEDVETDLDQSFRTKVFETIKASFGTVKTVVAQRND